MAELAKGVLEPDYLEQLASAKTHLENAREARDALVRAAAAAGVPKTHIARAVGLSAMHVHRLIGSSDSESPKAAPSRSQTG